MRNRQRLVEIDSPADERSERTLEAELRRWVGGRLKQPGCRVPDPVWKDLRGLVADVIEEDTKRTRQELRKAAHASLAAYRAKRRSKAAKKRDRSERRVLPSKETISREVDLSLCLDASELRRQELLTRELVRTAERLPDPKTILRGASGKPYVELTRDEFLGGRTVSDHEASSLLESLGASVFELEFFQANGIPLLAHESKLLTPRNFVAPGWDFRIGLRSDSEIEFRWQGGSLVEKVGDRLLRGTTPSSLRTERLRTTVMNSVVQRIEARAGYFCFRFPWTRHEAALFILTGATPTAHTMYVGETWTYVGPGYELATVQMNIQPWLSSAAVLKTYKQLQQILIGHRNRPPRIKSLEFYDFVSEQRHKGASWSEAMRAWTKKHPADRKRYPVADEDSAKRFASHFRDIARQLLRPFEEGAYAFRWASEEPKP